MRRIRGLSRVSGLLAQLPLIGRLFRNPLFDARWYLTQYPDVRDAGMDPYLHYRRHGIAEGRDPNAWFRTTRYLDRHPDARAAGMDPLDHYLARRTADESSSELPGESGGDAPIQVAARSGLGGRSQGRVSMPARRSRSFYRAVVDWLESLTPGVTAAAPTVLVFSDDTAGELRVGSTSLQPLRMDGSDTALIARTEWARTHPPAFLLVAEDTRPLLDQVPRFHAHVQRRYAIVAIRSGWGVLYDLGSRRPSDQGVTRALEETLQNMRQERGGRLSVLDRTGSRAGIAIEGVSVVADDPTIPWPPGSFDVVLEDDSRKDALRIATIGVIMVAEEGPPRISVVRATEQLADPAVSIVIPHYGSLSHLRACLASLQDTVPADVNAEILVVDDGTPGVARESLEGLAAGVPGGRLLVNETNLGFLATANRGAAEATGEILILLNDDTVMLPDWLYPLLRTFRRHPDAGVVGGRLVHPDGRLQEAGGSVFRDGSAMKYGYGDRDPDAPLYAYLREVDYVSGALLATPRALFAELGGLDPAYGFGFYEDADYCFRARRAGRRVLYQPHTAVIHVEGGTVGRDITAGHKRAQVENQALFRERWATELEGRPGRPRTVRPEDWYAVALGSPLTGAG